MIPRQPMATPPSGDDVHRHLGASANLDRATGEHEPRDHLSLAIDREGRRAERYLPPSWGIVPTAMAGGGRRPASG